MLPLRSTLLGGRRRAQLAAGYRRLLVPLSESPESLRAVDVACGLAAAGHATVVALVALEVPLELPLQATMRPEEALARSLVERARAVGDSYGVDVLARIVRTRNTGEAIVETARERRTEIVVVGTPRAGARTGITPLGKTALELVLRNAPCRVMIVAGRMEAEQGQRARATVFGERVGVS